MKRVLLKLSGEALAGDKHMGFDEPTVTKVAKQVKEIVDAGLEVSIVIGGGNFWRGRSSENIDRTKADQIGMLATVMNCIYVSEIFRSVGMKTQILTPFACGAFTKLFSKDRVNKYFEKGIVSFFAGGTGHPYFSTDTATVLRAIEIEADVILLAKSIDGVYDSDPKTNPDAKKYDSESHRPQTGRSRYGSVHSLHGKQDADACFRAERREQHSQYRKRQIQRNKSYRIIPEYRRNQKWMKESKHTMSK